MFGTISRKLGGNSISFWRITRRQDGVVLLGRIVERIRGFSTVNITYIEPTGVEKEVQAEIGENLLDVAQNNNIDLEGACGGELACATCHLIFEKDLYETLPEKEEEEEDMLDLAFELTDTSRLGCQIKVREDFKGTKLRIPDDGF
mmetsp:Transcript_28371/g.42894  ORF Transcript_28371/g.42894 Transcript_28371/m.42894 type:complete len:146 (-) Transcript_28371:2800-3237(-)